MKLDVKEKTSKENSTVKKVIIISSAMASLYTINYQVDNISNARSTYGNIGINKTDKGYSLEKNKNTSNAYNHKITSGKVNSYHKIININQGLISGNMWSNIPINESETKAQTELAATKEETDVQKLVSHRDMVEKAGLVTGLLLGISSFAPVLIFPIEWYALLPSSILFFSLSAFMYMRRKSRGAYDES